MRPGPLNRRFEWLPFYTGVSVHLLGMNVEFDAFAADISLAGVGLIGSRPLPVGKPVALVFNLKSPAGSLTERVFGRVVHIRSDLDAVFVGVDFAEVLGGHVPNLASAVERL